MHIKIMHEKVVIPYSSYKFVSYSPLPLLSHFIIALKSYSAQQLNAPTEKRKIDEKIQKCF
jgi:hypothetical protein